MGRALVLASIAAVACGSDPFSARVEPSRAIVAPGASVTVLVTRSETCDDPFILVLESSGGLAPPLWLETDLPTSQPNGGCFEGFWIPNPGWSPDVDVPEWPGPTPPRQPSCGASIDISLQPHDDAPAGDYALEFQVWSCGTDAIAPFTLSVVR